MIHSDPVTFYAAVCKYMTREYAISTTWVGLDTTDQLFAVAKRLVYRGNPAQAGKIRIWRSISYLI